MFIPPDGELDYKSRLVVKLKMSSAVYLNEILSFVMFLKIMSCRMPFKEQKILKWVYYARFKLHILVMQELE